MQDYTSGPKVLYSQTIHYIVNNSYCAQIPKLNALMLKYVDTNREFVGGEVLAHLLYSLYKNGYDSARSEINSQLMNPIDFDSFVNILVRDFNQMRAISIVKACLALYFYRALPIHLITRIFSMEFIERLENEMSHSYDTVRKDLNLIYSTKYT